MVAASATTRIPCIRALFRYLLSISDALLGIVPSATRWPPPSPLLRRVCFRLIKRLCAGTCTMVAAAATARAAHARIPCVRALFRYLLSISDALLGIVAAATGRNAPDTHALRPVGPPSPFGSPAISAQEADSSAELPVSGPVNTQPREVGKGIAAQGVASSLAAKRGSPLKGSAVARSAAGPASATNGSTAAQPATVSRGVGGGPTFLMGSAAAQQSTVSRSAGPSPERPFR
jgi:hypothetical protein